MKNKFLLMIGGMILLIFLIFGTYTWYNYFLEVGNNFITNPDNNLNNNLKKGNITLQDNGNAIYNSNANSIEDLEVDTVTPYLFEIRNSGNTASYSVYIEDLPLNAVNDGCTANTLLTRNQLKYELKLNGVIIKNDLLANIKDNILDTRTINSNQVNKYELRIYIHSEALDWTNKHYHYKIVLNNE